MKQCLAEPQKVWFSVFSVELLNLVIGRTSEAQEVVVVGNFSSESKEVWLSRIRRESARRSFAEAQEVGIRGFAKSEEISINTSWSTLFGWHPIQSSRATKTQEVRIRSVHSASQTWCGPPKTNEIWLPLFHDTLVNGDGGRLLALVAQKLAQFGLL